MITKPKNIADGQYVVIPEPTATEPERSAVWSWWAADGWIWLQSCGSNAEAHELAEYMNAGGC